ncbi:hypothetical protein H8E88_22665 [candidate division KSB1 bacterium]|nr:hypothetical protein [candidate division KSB1 bacterium]
MNKIFSILLFIFFLGTTSTSLAGKKGTVALGAKLSTPQLLSVSASIYPYHLWLVQFEPGIGGGKVNVGIGGNWHYTIGAAVKFSILQTWGFPIGGVAPNQTYVGGEMELMWQGVNMSFGLYSHVSGSDANRDMIVSAGLGIGF